jgi:outer membrane protein assembly factor BamA
VIRTFVVFAAALAVSAPAAAQPPAAAETLREVRVHGNHTTPDADILALAGLTLGAPISDATLAAAETRLRGSGRFADVEVRKRFRSIADPTDILVIVLVDEHEGVSEDILVPGPLRRLTAAGMWLPIVDYEDGYGFTYGAQISFMDLLGKTSRISVPLTWGGERRAGVEVERPIARGPISRVEGELSIFRRENPRFEVGDLRKQARIRAEREITSWLRVGAGFRVTQVGFDGADERHTAPGVDLLVDTRTDPGFPRNAVLTTVKWEQLRFGGDRNIRRVNADVRGYVGLIRSSVLALRVAGSSVDAPLPAYEQALLGGTSMLRGYRFGYRAGDNLAIASAELRVPITSPLSVGRFGVKAFVDAGTVFADGEKLSNQTWDRGVGGGIFFTAPVFRLDLDVAKPREGKVRVHFGLGVTF